MRVCKSIEVSIFSKKKY